MAERLVILSDMWGAKKGLWITSYLGYLQQYFDIVYYDCQQLASISLTIDSEENLSKEFANGGLDIAVSHILRRETEASHYLAFCTGADIAWNANLRGLPMKSLYAISPNKIDIESGAPNCPFNVVYGEQDKLKLSNNPLSQLDMVAEVIPGFGRELYSDEKIIKKVCQTLLSKVMERQYQY